MKLFFHCETPFDNTKRNIIKTKQVPGNKIRTYSGDRKRAKNQKENPNYNRIDSVTFSNFLSSLLFGQKETQNFLYSPISDAE